MTLEGILDFYLIDVLRFSYDVVSKMTVEEKQAWVNQAYKEDSNGPV